jgi:predicted alpha/beta superfamily hydrolase
MIKLKVVLWLCLVLFSTDELFAQQKKNKTKEIEVGKIFTLNSKILNEEREIYVSVPPGYDTLNSKFSVIYILDAEYRFSIAQSIISYFYITTQIPKVIVVGINNYGGEASKFTDFLSMEVFPFIEKNFKSNQTRYIAGHSHGGVFVVHTLLNSPDLFDGYIATDPSLKYMYTETDTLLNQNLNGKKLYLASSDIAYGNLEDVAADMQADFAVFKKYLYQSRESNNLKFKLDHIHDDHGNSYIQGISRGIRYIFNWRFE